MFEIILYLAIFIFVLEDENGYQGYHLGNESAKFHAI